MGGDHPLSHEGCLYNEESCLPKIRDVRPTDLPEEVEQVSWVHAHMNTTLLLVFLTGCVVIGFIIKIILMLLIRWRKRKEARSFERKYSTTARTGDEDCSDEILWIFSEEYF